MKELELGLLKMWEAQEVEEVYKYKNRINIHKRAGLAKITLFYDLTYGMFADLYDTANDDTTTSEDAKKSVKELIEARTKHGAVGFVKDIQALYDVQPISDPSDDHQGGYNAGWVDALGELAKVTGVEIDYNEKPALTEGVLNLLFSLKEQFQERIHTILDNKCRLETGETYKGDIEGFEQNGLFLHVETFEYSRCSCCSDETHWYSFPVAHLFDADFIEKLKNEAKLKQEADERKKQAEEDKRQRDKEERERKEYERLNKKYGGVE